MAGLFEDLDLANAEDRPKLQGKFPMRISDAEIQQGSKADPDKIMIVVEATLTLENGTEFPMKKWFTVPQGKPSDWDQTERPTKAGKGTTSDYKQNQMSRTALKEFFKSLGFGPEVMASVNEHTIADILVGTEGSVVVRPQKDGDFSEIVRYAAAGASGVTAPTARPSGPPTAAATSTAPTATAPVAAPANNPFAKQPLQQ